jgi:tetratricopeptide (TPR) repeat protein
VNAGEPAAAERDAREALQALPGRTDLRSVLALALDAQGRGDEAIAELRKLPADLPLPAAVALRLSAAESEAGEVDTALRRIERALQEVPDDPLLGRGRGLLLARSGRHQEAFTAFEAALALPQTDARLRAHLHYLCAEALFELGRLAEARRALDQALASPEADAAEWRSGAAALRDRLDSGTSPQGGSRKNFSLIDGKWFPQVTFQPLGSLGSLGKSHVQSGCSVSMSARASLAPELHQNARPNGSTCAG